MSHIEYNFSKFECEQDLSKNYNLRVSSGEFCLFCQSMLMAALRDCLMAGKIFDNFTDM